MAVSAARISKGAVPGWKPAEPPFRYVDYDIDLMFNQTKWNDGLSQKN